MLPRFVLAALAALLIGSLAVAAFWPDRPAASETMSRADVVAAPVAGADAAPASRGIFPKVLRH
jgi:hypothetical protein